MSNLIARLFLVGIFTLTGCTSMSLKNPSRLTTLPFSAASGLVKVEKRFFIISDDETELFSWNEDQLRSFPLLEDKLPDEPKARKNAKPDFEALILWDGEIAAIPSLSRPNRVLAVFFNPKTEETRSMNLSGLRDVLIKEIPELNIEGAAIDGTDLILLQRGNGENAQNAIIVLEKASLKIKSITEVSLGTMNDTALGFTDLFLEGKTLYFIAVAETGKSTYDDGRFAGAILGKMDLTGKIHTTLELSLAHKPEGLWLEHDKIFIVTDADDRTIPSGIYSAPRPAGF